MEDDGILGFQLLVLFFLILLNAFFAASEVALISLKQAAGRRLTEQGGRRGKRLAALLADSGRFLATVQVGVTFAGFMASAFAADSFSDPLTDWLLAHGVTFLSRTTLDAVIVLLITLVLSYLSLVFGELIPKQLGLRYAETFALYVAGPIDWIAKLTAPFVWLLNASVNFFLKLFGGGKAVKQEVTEEEIRLLVDIGEENGVIASDEKQMIENVFEFNNKTAGDVMTHRTEVVALNLDTPPEEIEKVLLECGFSRVPVYHEDIDEIVGILHFRAYFAAKLSSDRPPDLRQLITPAYFAPATMRANVLFQNMRNRQLNLSVVLDEFGGTAGIVTLEDLLEEIVGSLYDEYDDTSDEVQVLGDGRWRLNGSMRLDEVTQATGIPLPEEDYDTLGGLIFGQLNAVPTTGAKVTLPAQRVELVVESVVERRADKVLMTVKPPVSEESAAAADAPEA